MIITLSITISCHVGGIQHLYYVYCLCVACYVALNTLLM